MKCVLIGGFASLRLRVGGVGVWCAGVSGLGRVDIRRVVGRFRSRARGSTPRIVAPAPKRGPLGVTSASSIVSSGDISRLLRSMAGGRGPRRSSGKIPLRATSGNEPGSGLSGSSLTSVRLLVSGNGLRP